MTWQRPGPAVAQRRARLAPRKPPRPAGNCYSTAVREAEKVGPEALVCHGTAIGQGPIDGIPHGHAWVEVGDIVIDRSNGADFVGPAVLYYALGKLTNIRRYSQDEVRRLLLEHKHYGPWEEEA